MHGEGVHVGGEGEKESKFLQSRIFLPLVRQWEFLNQMADIPILQSLYHLQVLYKNMHMQMTCNAKPDYIHVCIVYCSYIYM